MFQEAMAVAGGGNIKEALFLQNGYTDGAYGYYGDIILLRSDGTARAIYNSVMAYQSTLLNDCEYLSNTNSGYTVTFKAKKAGKYKYAKGANAKTVTVNEVDCAAGDTITTFSNNGASPDWCNYMMIWAEG